ncbi:protein of unknown function [Streptomyces sp. KY70]|nr:protein of unknown function [Streptomyces sp. KY70]
MYVALGSPCYVHSKGELSSRGNSMHSPPDRMQEIND